ncbi:MAG: fermentation-respiration switch protein FrsA (DUF1100 family), partial [Myxococcota bacterium]
MSAVLLLLSGCFSTDFFFFNPVPLDAYLLESDLIPAAQIEEVTFTTSDGLVLYGVWAWQEQRESADTLVHFHGNRDNIDFHFDRIELYWSYGYNVFTFDYRGYGRSEGTPTHDGVLLDGQAALAAATEAAPSSDLWLHGTSLGSYVALNTAVDSPPLALITEDLFSSVENLIETNAAVNLPPAWLFEGDWDAQAAAARLHDVPWRLIHGDADTYVLPSHAEWLYAAANDPKDLWLVPGGNHGPITN